MTILEIMTILKALQIIHITVLLLCVTKVCAKCIVIHIHI